MSALWSLALVLVYAFHLAFDDCLLVFSSVFGEHYPFVHKLVHEHWKTHLLHQALARLRFDLDFLSVYQPLYAAYNRLFTAGNWQHLG